MEIQHNLNLGDQVLASFLEEQGAPAVADALELFNQGVEQARGQERWSAENFIAQNRFTNFFYSGAAGAVVTYIISKDLSLSIVTGSLIGALGHQASAGFSNLLLNLSRAQLTSANHEL